ncbi:MAG: hypothetical protein ACE5HJ_02570 [Thermoplasmata archaeon]
MNGEDRPSGALVLSTIGLAFHIAAFAVIIIVATLLSGAVTSGFPSTGPGFMVAMLTWFLLWVVAGLIIVALGVVGVSMMNSASVDRVRVGSVIILLVAILGFPTFWGFVIGSLLMFVGAILGLVWQPPHRLMPTPGP